MLLGCWSGLAGFGILAAEALDAASGVDEALLAGEEGVAGGADFDVDVALVGRTGFKAVATGAENADGGVVGVDLFLGHL